jgi:hypothetical protein
VRTHRSARTSVRRAVPTTSGRSVLTGRPGDESFSHSCRGADDVRIVRSLEPTTSDGLTNRKAAVSDHDGLPRTSGGPHVAIPVNPKVEGAALEVVQPGPSGISPDQEQPVPHGSERDAEQARW